MFVWKVKTGSKPRLPYFNRWFEGTREYFWSYSILWSSHLSRQKRQKNFFNFKGQQFHSSKPRKNHGETALKKKKNPAKITCGKIHIFQQHLEVRFYSPSEKNMKTTTAQAAQDAVNISICYCAQLWRRTVLPELGEAVLHEGKKTMRCVQLFIYIF